MKGKYSFKDKFDRYEVNIIRKKDKYEFESLVNLKNNLIIIKEIDYNKDVNSSSIIKLKGSYKNSKLLGVWQSYSENGVLIDKVKYN